MSNPIRLALATTARGGGFESGSGGVRDIPPEMINFALAGCDHKCLLSFRAFNLGEYSRCLAEVYLITRISRLAVNEKWKFKKGQLLKLCHLAVAEATEPRKFKQDKEKAIYFGVKPSTWCETWSKRYSVAYSYIVDWQSKAVNHAWNRMEERE